MNFRKNIFYFQYEIDPKNQRGLALKGPIREGLESEKEFVERNEVLSYFIVKNDKKNLINYLLFIKSNSERPAKT